MNNEKPHLIFVYNADSGLFSTVSDIAHKIFSPATYSCQLCQLTHGYFSVQKQWTTFLEQLDVELDFLHRDELIAKYNLTELELPVILQKQTTETTPTVFLSAADINACEDLDQLQTAIKTKLSD